MGGKLTVFLGLLCCLVTASFADPPTVSIQTTFADRGEFYHITLAERDTLSPGVYLTGIGLQQQFQAYAVKVDTDGVAIWSRLWGTTNYMYDCLWRDGMGRMIGYTTENSTPDYKFVQFNGAGSLDGQWDFGGNVRADRGNSAAYYDSTFIIVVGSVTPGDSSTSDGSLVLVDDQGGVEWSHTYHESAAIRRVQRMASGNIMLFGTADSVAGRNRDFWMGRTDSTGTLLSSRRFGALRSEEMHDAVRVDSSLSLLIGSTRSFGDSTKTNIFVLATNDNGDSLWSDVLGGTENDAGLCVLPVADRDSGFVIGGYWSEQHLGTRNAFLLKYDQDFDSMWTVIQFDTVVTSEFRDVAVDSLFRYHAAGIRNTGLPHGYYAVTTVDPAAPLQHNPDPFSILSPADNAFFTVDTIRFTWEAATDPDPGDQIAYALLLDTDTLFDNPQAIGPLSQTTTRLTRTEDIFDRYWRVMAQDQFGNLRLCNESYRHVRKIRPDSTRAFDLIGPPNGDAIVNPFATFSWELPVDPDSVDETLMYSLFFQVGDSVTLIDTLLDTTATVNFTDHPFIHQSDTVAWWVVVSSNYPQMQRHSSQTWTFVNWNVDADDAAQLPTDFAMLPAYPNPFNATVNLQFTLAQAGDVQLRIYDVTGRETATLLNRQLAPGVHVVQWTGENAASGVYFARLMQSGKIATQKLLLLK